MEKLYSEKEASEYLGVTKEKLNSLVHKKKLPAYKVGGEFLRFYRRDLDFVKKNLGKKQKEYNLFSSLKDYIYYNDFYIIVAILIIILLSLIFKISF